MFFLKVSTLKDAPGSPYFGLGDLLSLAGIEPPWVGGLIPVEVTSVDLLAQVALSERKGKRSGGRDTFRSECAHLGKTGPSH